MTDSTHDPALKSWVESANEPGTDFPIQNLPYATYRTPGSRETRVGVAIGDMVLDATAALDIPSMKALLAMTSSERREIRRRVSELLSNHTPGTDRFLQPRYEVELLLPFEI